MRLRVLLLNRYTYRLVTFLYIPMLIMYIIFQRQIVAGMTSGAVKG